MVPPHTEHIVLERRGSQNQPRDCAHLEAQEGDKRETQREEVEVGRRPPPICYQKAEETWPSHMAPYPSSLQGLDA